MEGWHWEGVRSMEVMKGERRETGSDNQRWVRRSQEWGELASALPDQHLGSHRLCKGF